MINLPQKFFNLIFLYLALLLILVSCNKEDDSANSEVCLSDQFYADKCIVIEKNDLIITQDSSSYYLTDNNEFKLGFEYMHEAERALEVIDFYNFDQYCFIGNDSNFSFFLSNGEIPHVELKYEDCIDHEVCKLEVKYLPNIERYGVVEGSLIYSSVSQDTALQVLETLKFFQSRFSCYVGRPKTKMQYLRSE